MTAESLHMKRQGPDRIDVLLCPWPLITERIVGDCVSKHSAQGWQQPRHRWEIAPYASVVARIGERERWLHSWCKYDGVKPGDSFTERPPTNGARQVSGGSASLMRAVFPSCRLSASVAPTVRARLLLSVVSGPRMHS